MKRNLLRTALWTGLATLIVQRIASFIWGDGGPPESTPFIGFLFPAIWLFFLVFHLLTLQLFQRGDNRSTIYYLGLLGGKMFLAMLTVLLYGFFNPEGLRTFASLFLPLYAVLTGLQVVETLSFVRAQERDRKGSEEG
jgi:hypothetical protein